MTPVRPTGASIPAAAPSPVDAARLAAQKAFFDAALGRAPGAAQPAPTAQVQTAAVAPRPASQHINRVPDPGDAPPARILRPGSLLDIRI